MCSPMHAFLVTQDPRMTLMVFLYEFQQTPEPSHGDGLPSRGLDSHPAGLLDGPAHNLARNRHSNLYVTGVPLKVTSPNRGFDASKLYF